MRLLRRAVLLGAAMILIPACEENDGDPFGAADVYFVDTFLESGIGSTWDVSGTAEVDFSQGSPPPSLALSRRGRAWTRAQFFGRDMRVTVAVSSGRVEIVASSGESLASADVSAERAAVRAGGLSASVPLPAGPAFHVVSYRVDEFGTAQWRVDNQIALTATGLPATMVFVRLAHLGGPTAFFDSVIVSGN